MRVCVVPYKYENPFAETILAIFIKLGLWYIVVIKLSHDIRVLKPLPLSEQIQPMTNWCFFHIVSTFRANCQKLFFNVMKSQILFFFFFFLKNMTK